MTSHIKHFLILTILTLSGLIYAQEGIVLRFGKNIDKGFGGQETTVITPYVVFTPEKTQAYLGNQITHVNIGLNGEATNVYVYIKKNPKDTETLYKQKIGTLNKGWNCIKLDTPFELTGDSVSIGYKASFSSKNPDGVGCSAEYDKDADFIYWNSQNKWHYTSSSICIQAIVNGEQLPDREVALEKLNNLTAPVGKDSIEVTTALRNLGTAMIENFEVAYTVDGITTGINTFQHSIATNETDTFSVNIPCKEPGTHEVCLEVIKVNQQADAYDGNNAQCFTMTVHDPKYLQRVVMEEGTGTWCGWCPRGIVGAEMMAEEYPEQFITICIHGNDPLEIEDYTPLLDRMAGFPYCYVNRQYEGDPYYDIRNMFNIATSTNALIGYELEATFNADSTEITIYASMTARERLENIIYRASFVVVEDSVTGYKQANYYEQTPDEPFFGWESLPNPTDIVYNDVARGIYSSYEGEPCLPETLEAETTYEYSYTFAVPTNIQRKQNLRVVGLLTDPQTGYIVNADQTTPQKENGSSIISLNEPTPIAKVYLEENNIVIRLNKENPEKVQIALYTSQGVLIHQSTTSSDCLIPVNELKGVHFVWIQTEERIQTEKILL